MTAFADLHVPGRPFLLPNCWDAASAVLLADSGHPAVATTSLGVTAAAGFRDGARHGRDLTVALVRLLAGRLPVPLSVDFEDGYADDPAAVADACRELADLGVAGVNLEDAGRSGPAHAAVVGAVKERCPGLFVNARTDAYWSGPRDLDDAVSRLAAYRDAGADGLFVPGIGDDRAGLARIVALGPPVNVLWHAGADRTVLADLGVARISTGSGPYRAALAAGLATAATAAGLPAPAEVSYPRLQELLG